MRKYQFKRRTAQFEYLDQTPHCDIIGESSSANPVLILGIWIPSRSVAFSYSFPQPEIRQLIDQNMATGLYASEDDLVQAALHMLSDDHATIADIRTGMSDYQNERGMPLAEAFTSIRQQLSSSS